MTIISGTLKSTTLPWLPMLTNIVPPDIHRQAQTSWEYLRIEASVDQPIHEELMNPPRPQPKSRKPFWWNRGMRTVKELWCRHWENASVSNDQIIWNHTQEGVPGLWCMWTSVECSRLSANCACKNCSLYAQVETNWKSIMVLWSSRKDSPTRSARLCREEIIDGALCRNTWSHWLQPNGSHHSTCSYRKKNNKM